MNAVASEHKNFTIPAVFAAARLPGLENRETWTPG